MWRGKSREEEVRGDSWEVGLEEENQEGEKKEGARGA